MACSLRSEDVLLKRRELKAKRDFYKYDKELIIETKKLRSDNMSSLHAHVSYINVRAASSAMIAQYKVLFDKEKAPFYEYLYLRATLTAVKYDEPVKRNEIIKKLEDLVLKNESLREEGIYDLSYFLLRDKIKARSYTDELLKKKPNYLPYEILLARQLKANDEASKIIELCDEGLNGKEVVFDLCSNLSDLNEGNALDFLQKRDELLELMVKIALKSKNKKDLGYAYSQLESLVDEGNVKLKKTLEEFVAKVLERDPLWIPKEYYRLYFGNISYDEYLGISKMGKLNKLIDFKERVREFENLLKDPSITKSIKAKAYANLGYAYLNPANVDKSKAFEYFMLSNELEEGNEYIVLNLLDLFIELKKDPDMGLKIVDDILKSSPKKTEEQSERSGTTPTNFLESFKDNLSDFYYYQGRLYLLKNDVEKARLSFLNSYLYKENEKTAYFLGEVYSEKNPILALEFLTKSLKQKNESEPLKEELVNKRKSLIEKIHSTFYGGKWNEEVILSLSKEEKSEEKVHPFVGKPIVKGVLADFLGGDYDWSKLEGQNVILSFWATWCTPCFQEMAVLNKIQKEGKLKNLKIIGVCTDGISQKRKVKKILAEGKIEFDILLDDGAFRDKYMVSAIPSMFFLNTLGVFIKQKTGYSPDLEKQIFKIFK